MQYELLRTELMSDPVALGYSGLSDSAAATKLNAANTGRTLPRRAVPKSEVLAAIANTDWPTTAVLQNKLMVLMSVDVLDASSQNVKDVIASIFGAGTASRTNLLAISTQIVSRADELGLGPVQTVDVTRARAGVW